MDSADSEGQAFCGGQRFERIAATNGASPYVELAADGRTGPFLLDYGLTRSSLSADVFGGMEGTVRRAAISLPGVGDALFRLSRYDLPLKPAQGQFGAIGSDLLSRLTVEITPDAVLIDDKPCKPETLASRGLVPVDQAGFFGSDPAKLDLARPNVPIVYARIGETRAFAQVDTGYDDAIHRHSVDINEALYEALVANGVKLDRIGEIDVWTCDGRERRPVFKAEGRTLGIENERGKPIARTDDFRLLLKQANQCGGIADMSEPAAQLGASFLDLFGSIVFDPRNATVWAKGGSKGE